jgi:mannose-1-phosphate guanylyltransferase
MRGFILAAGFGTRLRPITDHIPKALVPVAGVPLLGHALEWMWENDIREIGVNTHYLPEMIRSYRQQSRIPFTEFHETRGIRGTGGAFHFARDFLLNDNDFFVANVDIIARFPFPSAVRFFRESQAHCVLLAFPPKAQGTILFDKETGLYKGTPDTVKSGEPLQGADFIGAALYRKEYLDYIGQDDFSIVPTWSRAVDDGKKVLVYVFDNGFWRDIGTPGALLDIHCDIIDKKVEIPVPADFSIDYERKVGLASGVSYSGNYGEYSWVESSSVALTSEVYRSVIFKHAVLDGKFTVHNAIVTEWGIVPAI